MKHVMLSVVLAVLVCAVSGCTTVDRTMADAALEAAPPATVLPPGRMLIWRARLSLEVANVSDAVSQVREIAEQAGGYVESKSEEQKARVVLRVPVEALTPAMSSLEDVGRVIRRSISSDDVTERYVDTEARLQTMIALRDRLQALLDRAENVSQVLTVERELSRVQSDIDAMEARLRSLRAQVDLATIEVSISRRVILGPVGYIIKGTFWTIGKLFVIQD